MKHFMYYCFFLLLFSELFVLNLQYWIFRVNQLCVFVFFKKSQTEDSLQPIWYDKACFFAIRRPISVDAIDGFANLKYNDQKEIRKCVNSDQPTPVDLELEKRIAQQNTDFSVNYDKLKRLNIDDCVDILKEQKQFVPEDEGKVRCMQVHSIAKFEFNFSFHFISWRFWHISPTSLLLVHYHRVQFAKVILSSKTRATFVLATILHGQSVSSK